MDEIMLHRLRLLSLQIKTLSDLAATSTFNSDEEIEKSDVTATKLTSFLQRLNNDLLNYFKLSVQPSSDEINAISDIQITAEQELAELSVKLKSAIRTKQSIPKEVSQTTSSLNRLPKIALPQFHGDILEWHQFWDQYQSNIGSQNLSDVDKLIYLKSSLSGDASKAVEGLDTTSRNYNIAVATLKERYGNPTYLIDAHYAALSRVPAADESIRSCRETQSNIERHLRVLESLGENTDHNHLRHLILERFPVGLVYELKLKLQDESITDIRRQLDVIITAKEDASRIGNWLEQPVAGTSKKQDFTTRTLHVSSSSTNSRGRQHKTSAKSHKLKGQHRDTTKQTKVNVQKFYTQRDSRKRSNPFKNPSVAKPDPKRRKLSCIFCQGSHFNDQCLTFDTLEKRRGKLKGRCYVCLQEGHTHFKCSSGRVCYYCKGRGQHDRSLCPKQFDSKKTVKPVTVMTSTVRNSVTVLQTAVVRAKNVENSKAKDCRLLLDSGSQRTYVTQKVVKDLGLAVEGEDILSVFTFGAEVPQEFESPVVKLQLQSRTGQQRVIHANVVPMISQGVPYHEHKSSQLGVGHVLADDGSMSDRVDILIGNDYYHTLILTGKIKLDENLFMVESELGWILSGKVEVNPLHNLSVITYFQNGDTAKLCPPDLPLDVGNVAALWKLESIGITDSPKANRDEEAVDNFNQTTEFINGRYTVSWPWNDYLPTMSSNFGLAYGRLVNLLKRLDQSTLEMYDRLLKDQLEEGIIERVIRPTKPVDHPVQYLPHHHVPKGSSSIRIVYDASAKSKDSKSLNECLYRGPMMLGDLTELLLRFRLHNIAISADVEKAFLQIALHENDRDVTRFLWIRDLSKPVSKDNLICICACGPSDQPWDSQKNVTKIQ